LEILRHPSLTEAQYAGCVSAFVDSLAGELNAAATYLKRLQGSAKGAGFAHEIGLDRGRYGALLVLDRWRHLNTAFGPHLRPMLLDSSLANVIAESERRVSAAEVILDRMNDMIDAAESYHPALIEAALLGLQQASRIFEQENQLAEKAAALGPLIPEEQKAARAVFRMDLAKR
jgi:hypothetical protein